MAGLPLRRWIPDAPKGVCVLVHGMGEHSGRYVHVAKALNDAGYGGVAFDLRGHGRAEGFPGQVESSDVWLDELGAIVDNLRVHPEVPLFLVAHSMGTLVALAFLATRGQEGVAGAVLSGTAVFPGPAVVRSMEEHGAIRIPPELLSHDEAVVRAYAEDPLVFQGDVPAETVAAAMTASAAAYEGVPSITVPVLLVHGAEDAICDPAGAKDVHDRIGSADKALVVYDGLYHEILNEPEGDRVLSDIVGWLDARR